MSSSLVGAVRGPLLLVTLGLLFVVDRFGEYTFSQTWPVLIIVFGAMKLLDLVFSAPRSGPAAPGGMVS